jgi:hypothetical protein
MRIGPGPPSGSPEEEGQQKCMFLFYQTSGLCSVMRAGIVGRRSKLKGGNPYPFSQKSGSLPTLSKILLLSRKSTKIGKKLTKSRQIAESCLKHFKMTPKGFFERFLSI